MLTVAICGYLATFGHFQIAATENVEKSKSGISITQPLFVSVTIFSSKYMFLLVGNLKNW